MNRSPTTNQDRFSTLVAVALYSIFVALLLWPLWAQVTSRLPLGTEEVRTVPLFNQWTIWWNANRLGKGLENYWDAPIFFPDRNTFAYSEPQPLTMLLAPLVWWSGPTLAYNVYLAVSLLLNGCLAHCLMRWLGYNWLPTVAGSMATIALPVIHWQLGVIQLVPMWGVVWSIWALAKLHARSVEPSNSLTLAGIEFGTAMALTSWMAIYHALFLTTLLAISVLVMGTRLLQRNVLLGMAVSILVCVILISPMLGPMWLLSKNAEFVRPSEIVELLSLLPRDYLATYGPSPLSQLYIQPERYWRMNPGWIKIGLALVGLCVWWQTAQIRRWTVLLLAIGATAFVLSMGSHLAIGGVNLWEWLSSTLPGFKQVRSPFRYGYFVQLTVVLGAAGGLQALWLLASHASGRWMRGGLQAGIVALAVCALVDPLPYALRLCVVPDLAKANDWCAELRRAHLKRPGAALCLPMAGGDEARDFEKTCEWMLLATSHRVPLVNGYSGFCPQRVSDFGARLVSQPLTGEQLSGLYKQGVRYLIVERGLFKLPWSSGQPVSDLKLQLLISSPSGIDVYCLNQL